MSFSPVKRLSTEWSVILVFILMWFTKEFPEMAPTVAAVLIVLVFRSPDTHQLELEIQLLRSQLSAIDLLMANPDAVPQKKKTVLPTPEVRVKQFCDPATDNFHQWCRDVRCQVNELPEPEKLRKIHSYVSGKAAETLKMVLEINGRAFDTLESLLAELKLHFIDEMRCCDEFFHAVREENESIKDYGSRLYRAFLKLFPEPSSTNLEVLSSKFFGDLPLQIQAAVVNGDTLNFKEILSKSIIIERNLQRFKKELPPKETCTHCHRNHYTHQCKKAKIDRLQSKNRPSFSDPLFNCL